MANWVNIGSVSDFPEGEHVCTNAQDRSVVVIHLEGQLFVIANVCPHAGFPLGEGQRSGVVLTCPYHGYAYNVKTGRHIDWPYDELPVKTYPVRVDGDILQVDLEPDATGEP